MIPIPGLLDVTGGGRYTWVRFTPQQIRDEAEVEVVAGSMGQKEEALERAQFIQGMKAVNDVALNAQAFIAMGMNPVEIAKELFRRFGNTETDRFFGNPMQLMLGGLLGGAGAQPGALPTSTADVANGEMQTQQSGGAIQAAFNRGPASLPSGEGGT